MLGKTGGKAARMTGLDKLRNARNNWSEKLGKTWPEPEKLAVEHGEAAETRKRRAAKIGETGRDSLDNPGGRAGHRKTRRNWARTNGFNSEKREQLGQNQAGKKPTKSKTTSSEKQHPMMRTFMRKVAPQICVLLEVVCCACRNLAG